MYTVHLTFQCSNIAKLNYHVIKQNQDNSSNFVFHNWERSTIEKPTTWQHGVNYFFFFTYNFFYKNINTEFSSRHRFE